MWDSEHALGFVGSYPNSHIAPRHQGQKHDPKAWFRTCICDVLLDSMLGFPKLHHESLLLYVGGGGGGRSSSQEDAKVEVKVVHFSPEPSLFKIVSAPTAASTREVEVTDGYFAGVDLPVFMITRMEHTQARTGRSCEHIGV